MCVHLAFLKTSSEVYLFFSVFLHTCQQRATTHSRAWGALTDRECLQGRIAAWATRGIKSVQVAAFLLLKLLKARGIDQLFLFCPKNWLSSSLHKQSLHGSGGKKGIQELHNKHAYLLVCLCYSVDSFSADQCICSADWIWMWVTGLIIVDLRWRDLIDFFLFPSWLRASCVVSLACYVKGHAGSVLEQTEKAKCKNTACRRGSGGENSLLLS